MSFLEKLKQDIGLKEEKKSALPKKEKGQSISSKKMVEKSQSKKEKAALKQKEESSEGQLAIDVYETETEFVVQSTIAGVKAKDLDITIEKDIVTIRGSRMRPEEKGARKYLYQECYWGPFSRKLILPEEIDESQVRAIMKDGVLTLRMPKMKVQKRKKIEITEVE